MAFNINLKSAFKEFAADASVALNRAVQVRIAFFGTLDTL